MTAHDTVENPIANVAPLGGTQDTIVGGVPPAAVAIPYVTASGCPRGDESDSGAGQEILSASDPGVGGVGVPLQAWSATPKQTYFQRPSA